MVAKIHLFLTVLLALNELVFATDTPDHAERLEREMVSSWHGYKLRHRLAFHHSEERERYQTFKSNYLHIKHHNREYALGKVSYSMALNKFAHMSLAEYKRSQLGFRSFNSSLSDTRSADQHIISRLNSQRSQGIPTSYDLVKLNFVMPVREQGGCGSCWAFTAAAALEILLAMKNNDSNNNKQYLSVQQLIDCDREQNAGCDGGFPEFAFRYIEDNGLMADRDYSYRNNDGYCRYDSSKANWKNTRHFNLPKNEDIMKASVYLHGPLAAAVVASCDPFRFYSHGIFHDERCSNSEDDLDHAVLIVGYGEENGQDFWLVRNSYGASWGENGYIRILRNRNTIGISYLTTASIL